MRRSQRKRTSGRDHPHDRRDHAPVQRAPDGEQRPQQRVALVGEEPVADLCGGAGRRRTMPTITPTVTPKPKIAWPAMWATWSNERQKT